MATSDRIESLLTRMTLEEKVGQLSVFADMVRPFAADVNPEVNMQNSHHVLEQVRAGRVGSLFNGVGAELGRQIQKIAVEESRLGIPVIFAADVIHGMRTVFPIPLGEAASFEPELARRTARATAIEATAAGIHWTYAPAVDISRDQRWGRSAEGAGEDTFLGCAFARARVRGFQGDDLAASDSLLATPKHFAAYGAVTAGLEYNTVDIAPQTLHDVHLLPFKAAIEAGAITVMSAFNDINGVPASANFDLLTTILRDQWHFPGIVISDYTAEMELIAHGYAADEWDATKKAFLAGLDLSMQSGFYANHLPVLVKSGDVPIEKLDASVRRMLWLKERIGLFDNPYRSLQENQEVSSVVISAHDQLAREAACRSIVLLKNSDDVLPLRKENQRIALIGPFVEDRDNIEGCWTLFGDKNRYVSLAEGIRAVVEPDNLQIVRGCDFESTIPGGIADAVDAAQNADVVILALGEPQRYSGEAQSRTEIVLPAAQRKLSEALATTGKPIVVLLRNGRALALPSTVKEAAALLVTWYLGTQTGAAVADVLFGDYNPSGRLPISFPHVTGQQPYFYNHPRTGRPELPAVTEFKARWRELPNEPLYPFGYGLSYTQFEYGQLRLDKTDLGWDDTLEIRVAITNVGAVAGEEVVQLYIHDRVASRVRPVRELKGFQKIRIEPQQSVEVIFTLDRSALAFTNPAGAYEGEPGLFDLWVCANARSGTAVQFNLLPKQTVSTSTSQVRAR